MRSGWEEKIAQQLRDEAIPFDYEKKAIEYEVPVRVHKYTADFEIPKTGIILETKGRFTAADRKKHLLVRASNPDLDIRFVFQRDQPIQKKSKTLYSDWCIKHGYKYCVGYLPERWLDEIREIRGKRK